MRNRLVFLLFCCITLGCIKQSDQQTIGLQLLNDFSKNDLKAIKDSIFNTYQSTVRILPKIDVPKVHITRIKSYRFRADSILNLLDRKRHDSIDIMVGLTTTDIAITKMDKKTGEIKKPASTYTDWAIFGLGRINGTSCVVSNYRLKKGVGNHKYLKRLTRIVNHEIGHVLGLPHCANKSCLMNDANETIKTIDNSTGKLCEACKQKIL